MSRHTPQVRPGLDSRRATETTNVGRREEPRWIGINRAEPEINGKRPGGFNLFLNRVTKPIISLI